MIKQFKSSKSLRNYLDKKKITPKQAWKQKNRGFTKWETH